MLTHEFGIVTIITRLKDHDSIHAPRDYDCIAVNDDYILPILDDLRILKTYWDSLDRLESGLAYHGTTFIPPESLAEFQGILLKSSYREKLTDLVSLISKAISKNNYMIHFGL